MLMTYEETYNGDLDISCKAVSTKPLKKRLTSLRRCLHSGSVLANDRIFAWYCWRLPSITEADHPHDERIVSCAKSTEIDVAPITE